MKEYKLTFTVTINAQDDPAARQQAKAVLDNIKDVVPDTAATLKEIFKDRPPRGVAFRK